MFEIEIKIRNLFTLFIFLTFVNILNNLNNLHCEAIIAEFEQFENEHFS